MKLINNTALVFGLSLSLAVACGKSEDGGGDGDGAGGSDAAAGGSASGGAGDTTGSGGRFQSAAGGQDATGDGGGNLGGGPGAPGGGGNGDPADPTTCDEVDEPCCAADQGPAQCGNGLTCDGFGPQASCQAPPDTTACDTAGDPCCESSGFGPGICAEGLVCQREGTAQEATTSCVEETDPSEVDTTECDEVGDACCSAGQGPGSSVCGNGLECAFGGQGVGRVCAEPE